MTSPTPSISILTPQEGRAVPFNADARTFYVYRVCEGRTYPLVVDCLSLEEAIEGGKVRCFHKDQLLIREVGGGLDRLHVYSIKQKAQPKYVYRDYGYDRVNELYAAPVCTIDMRVLA